VLAAAPLARASSIGSEARSGREAPDRGVCSLLTGPDRMTSLPTLRRELITAFAVVFAGALLVAAAGVVFLLPRLADPRQAAVFLTLLILIDVGIFALFGRMLLQRRVLTPIEQLIDGVEAVAGGDYGAQLPAGETRELARLTAAVNHMAERLVSDQRELAANIRSLDDTNLELTEARDVMIRAEKLASVGRLSAGIAHEVGNPLAAVLGYLGLIGRHADEKSLELIRAAEREAHRIDRIVRGLLDYARPREVRAQLLDVNAMIRETIELVRTQGRFTMVELTVELGDDVPAVLGDPYQLQQVLVNLFVNACDAMGEAPEARLRVRTRVRPVALPERIPSKRKDDPEGVDYSHRRRLVTAGRMLREDPVSDSGLVVEIVVADNGPGIPPAMIEQIFDPFVTTKQPGEGTGLGLAVCARLIETMAGVIRADNSADGGAVFTIVLAAPADQPASVT
jgi:two-component system, NtrC family, sensor kinase